MARAVIVSWIALLLGGLGYVSYLFTQAAANEQAFIIFCGAIVFCCLLWGVFYLYPLARRLDRD